MRISTLATQNYPKSPVVQKLARFRLDFEIALMCPQYAYTVLLSEGKITL